ncbi:unnamed protein product [Lactuca saligna]|uniref:Uncharacterized protein n=1 Tax=Lactuca saligna TaxID=75948 RepID=A0AA36EHM2_LACSI|nr:unnamed protein product [Lactuca saligna]
MERILNEFGYNPSVYWLEPVISFDFDNSSDLQLDFPITLKAFLFCSFEKIEKAPITYYNPNHSLFFFYLKHGKPQYQTWSSKKFSAIKVIGLIETESFISVHFKAVRGSRNSVFEFTLADLPCLNLYDCISLFSLLSKDA